MRFLYVIVFSIVAYSFTSCNKSEIEYDKGFKKSEAAWLKFKNENNNSYRFEVLSGSWTGFSQKTSIKVVDGVAVERSFTYTGFNNIRRPEAGWDENTTREILTLMNITESEFVNRYGKSLDEALEWREVGAMVGTTQNTSASTFLTLDEVYEKAKNDWLKKKPGVETYFETQNNGMISTCGYVPDNCADDCFSGITISLIEAL